MAATHEDAVLVLQIVRWGTEMQLDEAFWQWARIVESRPRRKASVHLRLDPATLDFFRSAGRGHLTRMANILTAYAEAQAQSKRGEG